MKKKFLTISIILTVFFLLVAIVFFFLMKNSEETDTASNPDEYDVSQVVDKINFLKLNTYDELKAYADEFPIYIQPSDDKTLFAIGELYIEESPVQLFYKLNEDGSMKRFDGYYSLKLEDASADKVDYVIKCFNNVLSTFFIVEQFGHAFYGEDGAPILYFDEQIYADMLEGKATYGLSVIDKDETYWYITAEVRDKEYVDFEFFRCFDLSTYNDNSPYLDLRITDETGE